jgi:hypothetical protein
VKSGSRQNDYQRYALRSTASIEVHWSIIDRSLIEEMKRLLYLINLIYMMWLINISWCIDAFLRIAVCLHKCKVQPTCWHEYRHYTSTSSSMSHPEQMWICNCACFCQGCKKVSFKTFHRHKPYRQALFSEEFMQLVAPTSSTSAGMNLAAALCHRYRHLDSTSTFTERAALKRSESPLGTTTPQGSHHEHGTSGNIDEVS